MTPRMKWARHPALTSPPVELDALVAVFHPASGETHLLSPESAGLLDRLGQGPATADALAQDIGETTAEISARLLDLLDAGLIVPA